MSAFEDDEDKHAFPLLRKAIEDVERQRAKTIEGHRPKVGIYDEYVEMMSNMQRDEHAAQIVRQLRAMLMMDECSIVDPEPGKPPVIHMKYGGRQYVMMLDNAT